MLSDEEFGTVLLGPLDREPTGPSSVDVGRAIADARRHRRRATVAGAAGAAAVMAVVVAGGVSIMGAASRQSGVDQSGVEQAVAGSRPSVAVPAGPTSCALQRLPVPAGQPAKSVVTGGDPSGRYILGRSYPGGPSHQVLIWDGGEVHTVSMPGDDQHLNDINSAGVAVGASYVGASRQLAAWVYQNGTFTRLAGKVAEARGINDKGVIVGSVGDKPALWSSAGSAPTMLRLPGAGWTGTVKAIDEDGTMVGTVQSRPDQDSVGYLWHPDGTGEPLPVPVVNGKPVNTSSGTSIRNGWVVGWAGLDSGRKRNIYAPRWNLRTGSVEVSTFPGLAGAVNGHGWIAGEHGEFAVLLADGALLPLPNLVDAKPRVSGHAYTISDDGTTLAGQVQSADGKPVAVLWHCR